MIDQELLQALESVVTRVMKDELNTVKAELSAQIKDSEQQTIQHVSDMIDDSRNQIMQDVGVMIDDSRKQTMQDAAVLLDAQFMKQFHLLAENQEAILRKMPSEDDMDIIDGTLQEHGEILKVHEQEIEKLKIAL